MFRRPAQLIGFAVGLALLAGCDLPQGAPVDRQVLRGADSPDAQFEVQPVTRASLHILENWPRSHAFKVSGWITRARGPATSIIEPGDQVSLTIWDNEDTSLLMQPQQKVVAMEGLTVSPAGEVFLPYLDNVYVAKMSPDQARATIQDRMKAIIPSAQVQLSHMSGRKSSVDLVSGVTKPGTYVMPDRDFTVLSLVAQGGGIAPGLTNPQIRLMREGRLYGISMANLLENPSLDTTLRGGDKVYVETDSRYFLSLGAAGKEAQVPFPTDVVTALDAVSLIGGVDEDRANPKGIMILRDYDEAQLRSDGTGPAKDRVVFTLDLTTTDGLFSAREFPVEHQDLVLVTESPIGGADTVIGLITGILGIGTRIDDLSE